MKELGVVPKELFDDRVPDGFADRPGYLVDGIVDGAVYHRRRVPAPRGCRREEETKRNAAGGDTKP